MDKLRALFEDEGTVFGRNYLRYAAAQDIRHAVLGRTMGRIPFIGRILYTFWDAAIGDSPYDSFFSLKRAAWALSFEYLGDFLFYHVPMHLDYEQSWLSRVPWPRRLHIHRAPCSIVGWRDKEGNPHAPNETCTRRTA